MRSLGVTVTALPYELHPEIPVGGISLEERWGSRYREASAMYARIEQECETAGLPFRLKTYSMDQPGIVARLTKVLRDNGINIEDLSARQESAAFAGSPLFLTEMRLTVPPNVGLGKLRASSRIDALIRSAVASAFEPGRWKISIATACRSSR